MDTDADGVIKVDQVMRVIELLGEQLHGELNPRQVNEIVDMLQKEEMMEIEGHLEKVLLHAGECLISHHTLFCHQELTEVHLF